MQKGAKCPICGGKDWTPARNDLGYPHWKSDGMRPTRMEHHRCGGCGFIASFAKGVTTGGTKPVA